jgi:BON domain
MNDRFRNDGNRGEADWRGERGRDAERSRGRSGESAWREQRQPDFRADPYEPQYSGSEDEQYGSPQVDRGDYGSDESRYGSQRQGGRPRQHSNVGHWGSGGRAGYSGGHASGGYGGSSGTNYDRDNASRGTIGGSVSQGGSQGYGAGQGYGGNHGNSGSSGGYYGGGSGFGGSGAERRFGREGFGQDVGFGAGLGQGYRGRDLNGPGADVRSGRGGFAGRGPKGYTRTDDRIREDVCERLSHDDDVDASEIEVSVKDGEVTLRGSVMTRSMKHDAEDLTEQVSGVKDVHNELRVMKGMLSELKDKLSGDDKEQHFANSGTKNTPASPSHHHS